MNDSPPRRPRQKCSGLENLLFTGRRPWLVSFIGAGGKTSLLKALALSARSKGINVLATTTTRVKVSEFSSVPFAPVELGDAGKSILAHLRKDGRIPFIHDGMEGGKFKGIAADEVGPAGKGFGAVLVESDGCRGMPLKRLRDHEPPLPADGNVVLVVGADAVGRPLEDACFNWEGAVAEGIVKKGQVLDAASIRRILYDPRGYLDVAVDRPIYLAVNTSEIGGGAEELARELYHPKLEGVFVTRVKGNRASSVEMTNRAKRIAAVVLAAGESRRFGEPKQSAPLGNGTVLGNVLGNILSSGRLEKVVVVLGHRHKKVLASVGKPANDSRLCFIVNEDYRQGMSSSIRAGIMFIRGFDAAAIFLGDQPFIGPKEIEAVVNAYLRRPCRLAYPVFNGRHGHPVILGRELFPGIGNLRGDRGARDIVEQNAGWAAEARVEAATQLDIDHQKDLKRAGHGRPR